MAEKSKLMRLSDQFGIRANMPIVGIREMAEMLDPLKPLRDMQAMQWQRMKDAVSPFTVPAQPRRGYVVRGEMEGEQILIARVQRGINNLLPDIDKLPPERQQEILHHLLENWSWLLTEQDRDRLVTVLAWRKVKGATNKEKWAQEKNITRKTLWEWEEYLITVGLLERETKKR